jgi:hypothetical protein
MRRIDEVHLKWPFLGARRLRDVNVLVEQLWRSVKHEEVNLHAYG